MLFQEFSGGRLTNFDVFELMQGTKCRALYIKIYITIYVN